MLRRPSGNWELPAVAAAAHGLPSAVVYRMPNNKAVAKEISRIRAPLMGRLIRTRAQAALEMAAALDRGEHLGMLVDQHFSRGVDVTFFGRRCKANPTVARLARQFDCPVVGVRVIRLPDRRFRIVAEGPFALPRDAAGQVDVKATTQMITDVVERWVREHPDQWLWFHRRWRYSGACGDPALAVSGAVIRRPCWFNALSSRHPAAATIAAAAAHIRCETHCGKGDHVHALHASIDGFGVWPDHAGPGTDRHGPAGPSPPPPPGTPVPSYVTPSTAAPAGANSLYGSTAWQR